MSEFDQMWEQREAIIAKQTKKARNAIIDECIAAIRSEIDENKDAHPGAVMETCIRILEAKKSI